MSGAAVRFGKGVIPCALRRAVPLRRHGTKDGPLYLGITNDLERRIAEHKSHAVRSHTAKYNIDRLVYVETFDDPLEAIARETVLKKWRGAWKIAPIEQENPAWSDLAGL